MPDSPFRMTVDLNVLDHLADGLYSSVAAVLTETVANAWDADARRVAIQLCIDDGNITIEDDGIGMDVDALRSTLPAEDRDHASMEVVFVVGTSPTDPPDRIEQAMNSVAPGSRIVTYDLLAHRARSTYAEYVDGAGSVNRLDRMFTSVEGESAGA